jgi:hypothetical protein
MPRKRILGSVSRTSCSRGFEQFGCLFVFFIGEAVLLTRPAAQCVFHRISVCVSK